LRYVILCLTIGGWFICSYSFFFLGNIIFYLRLFDLHLLSSEAQLGRKTRARCITTTIEDKYDSSFRS